MCTCDYVVKLNYQQLNFWKITQWSYYLETPNYIIQQFMLLIFTLFNNLSSVYLVVFVGTDWMWWWLDWFERRYWRCWEDSSFKWSYWKSGFVVRPERYHQVTFTLDTSLDFLIPVVGNPRQDIHINTLLKHLKTSSFCPWYMHIWRVS